MKKPTEEQLKKLIPDLGPDNSYIETYSGELEPGVEDSWGKYIKGKGWVTNKVFTGKAVREWILNNIKTLYSNSYSNIYMEENLLGLEEYLTREGLNNPSSTTKNIKYIIKNYKGENLGFFTTAVLVYKDNPVYSYFLSNTIPTSNISFNTSKKLSLALKDLLGWSNWKGLFNLYIILRKKNTSTEIEDYIDIKDILGNSILSDFIIIETELSDVVVIKLNGFSPIEDSDANAIITFK